MAVREIKTSITLDGEQAFRQAIAAANKELRVSEAELKAVASAYDLNGDKMQMLANKQRILGREITVQENTVSSLKARMKEAERVYEEAGKSVDKFRAELEKANASGNKSNIDQATEDVERAERAYAEARKQLQNYQIETSNATTKLNQMRKTQQATDREIEEFGRDSIKVGRQIEDGIGDSAEAAEKDVRNLVQTLQDDLSSIRASSTFTAIGSLWDMATDAYSAVSGFVDSTMDYRRQLSFLELNAEESGLGFDVVKNKLIETQAMTADASSAMEGLSNLLQIEGLSEDQLTRAMEGLLGASIKWQETLKFESLADSLQETLATGKAVGAYAELLERLGYNLDDFNDVLAKGELPADDIEAALAVLDAKEITDTYQEYKENNAELIKELETVARLEMASARIGAIIGRNITTPIKSRFTDVLDWIADEMVKLEKDPKGYVEGLPERMAKEIEDELKTDQTRTEEEIAAAGAFVRGEATDEDWNTLVNAASERAKREREIRNALKRFQGVEYTGVPTGTKGEATITGDDGTVIDTIFARRTRKSEARAWIESTFAARDNLIPRDQWQTVLFNRAADAQMAAMDAVSNLMEGWVSPEKTEKAGEEAATSFVDGWDSIVMRPDLAQEAQSFMIDEAGNTITPIGVREDWEEYLKTITDMASDYEEAGEEAGAAATKGLSSELEAGTDAAYTAGENVALSFGSGLASKISYVAAQAGALAAAASARMQTTRGGVVQAVFNVDGRQMATALAPYNSEILAVENFGDTPYRMR